MLFLYSIQIENTDIKEGIRNAESDFIVIIHIHFLFLLYVYIRKTQFRYKGMILSTGKISLYGMGVLNKIFQFICFTF